MKIKVWTRLYFGSQLSKTCEWIGHRNNERGIEFHFYIFILRNKAEGNIAVGMKIQ